MSCLIFSSVFICLGYISTSINDGPGCLMLRCPDPSCRAAVGQDMINLLASDEDNEKYSRYLLRSYIEDNRKVYLRLGTLPILTFSICNGSSISIFIFTFFPLKVFYENSLLLDYLTV